MLMRLDPLQTFNFHIEIEGLVTAGFSECNGLQAETEIQTYSEGGVNDFEHQFLGRTKYPRLVLRRGLTQIDGLWNWYRDAIKGKITRKNGTIYLMNSQRESVLAWHFMKAIPVKWAGPELRADSATIAFETVEIVHQGLRWEKV
jgi:phage tail-like protein